MLYQARLLYRRRMKCAYDNERIFGAAMPFAGCAQEQVQIFRFHEVVKILFFDFFYCGLWVVPLNAIPIELADFPILNHQRAYFSCIVLKLVGEFVRQLWHDFEIFGILSLEEITLFETGKNSVDLFLCPFRLRRFNN